MSSSVSCLASRLVSARAAATSRACRAFAPARAAILAPARRVSPFRVSAAADSSFLTAGGGGDDEPALTEDEITLRDVTRKLVDCRRRKAAANAVDLLVSLGRAGVEPDLFAATTCLGACVAAGKQDLALKVFEEVFAKGVVEPDEVVFVELMRGHLDVNPPEWSRVNALIGKMENTYDVVPTATTYNLLLGKCADDNELERAEDLVDRMADNGVEPDGRTLGAVKKRRSIRSYAKKVLHAVRVEKQRGEGGRALGIAKAGNEMRPSRISQLPKFPVWPGWSARWTNTSRPRRWGLPRTRQFQRRVALARGRRSRRGRMFGRFGGGGNFVAQYRCYPVSFIDRVRLPLQSAEPFQTRARRPQPPAARSRARAADPHRSSLALTLRPHDATPSTFATASTREWR